MKGSKAKRRLKARIEDFDKNVVGPTVHKGSNYHKPGSLKK